jgi:hypothetical protein
VYCTVNAQGKHKPPWASCIHAQQRTQSHHEERIAYSISASPPSLPTRVTRSWRAELITATVDLHHS